MFSILGSTASPFQLKINEAFDIVLEQPSLNRTVQHLNLTCSLISYIVFIVVANYLQRDARYRFH